MKIITKSIVFFALFINNSFSSETKLLKYCTSESIWKHAAYKDDNNRSYFDNIKSAIKSGYCGIEIDIIYDEKEKLIYVSHDPIYSLKEKKELSLENLDTIIQKKKIYIWLDWKNTKLLQLPEGLKIIQNSLKDYLAYKDSIVFIETPNILHNEFINFLNEKDNIYSLNWLSYGSHKDNLIENIKNIYRKVRARIYICVLKDRWVTSDNLKILQLCNNQRKVKSIFIFTINDKLNAKEAFKAGARVVLSDTLK